MWFASRTGDSLFVWRAAFCLFFTATFVLVLGAEFQSSCSADQHKCGDGTCLKKSQLCDGIADCADGSDEYNCDYIMCRSPTWFKCENGKCISHVFVADDNNDCGDWSDEDYKHEYQHQSANHSCLPGEFKCHDGMCIPFDWVCNGRLDCPDGSDEEQNCAVQVCDGFHCKSGQCIIAEFRCDGTPECSDGSDEQECPINSLGVSMSECLIERGLYACSDGVKCISADLLCNNHTDCLGAGDDEGPMCNTNRNMCETAGCSHTCHISPKGPLCSCPTGYRMQNESSKICEDVNECNIYGTCGQRCHNWQGGYGCSCEDGYILADDHKTCLAEQGSEATLIYSSSKEIRSYTLSSRHLSKVQGKQMEVVAVAFDGHNVYWSSQENGQERIMKSKEDGSKKEIIVSAGLMQPEDMAWDWVTRKIYFTDSGKKTVSACTDDGHWCTVLVNTVTDNPHGIVVVPQEGTMFWTDWGTVPHIATAGMDGSNPHMFVQEDLQWPNSIAVDYGNKRLYWVDAKFHFIESINLDGSDRKVVLKLPVSDAFSIAIFENRIYWSDFRGKEISSCDKFTGKNHSTIITDKRNTITGIHIYHPALQLKIINPCELNQCSHMCLLAPKGKYSCGCPSDMYLGKDGFTCVARTKTSAILVAAGNKLIKVQHQLLGKLNITYVPLQNVQSISALTYDPFSNAAIISDSVEKKIISFNLRKSKSSTLIDSQIGFIVDMEYDYAGRNLYWCDFERQVIEVYSFTTKERVVVVRDLHGDYPVSISITPTGLMFVGLTATHRNHIDTMSLDGHGHTLAIDELEGPPNSLTFHKGLHRVYWVDDVSGVFQSTDDEALDQHEWRKEQNEPISLAALGSFIFWTSKESAYLHWADVHSGQSKMTKLKLDVGKVPAMYLTSIDQPLLEPHSCQVENGGCSHVCFALQSGVKCGCPLGMHLKNDGHTCTTPQHCSKKEYRCKNDDLCIPKSLRCNGHTDCPSGEDEEGCENVTCESGSFTCKNGDCILQNQRCDGHADCKDSSDEEDCKEHISCDIDAQFTCFSGECVSRTLVCDGIKDCSDGSDESYCHDTSCSSEEFRCNDGMCIPHTWECDGTPDCKDGSDEHAKCEKLTCPDTDFTCSNGQCVDKQFVCDGQDDCGDGSDEVCEESQSREDLRSKEDNLISDDCLEGTYRCETTSKLVCLPAESKCNGIRECPFGDDESNCGCGDDTFECPGSKKCIQKVWLCDGYKDCPDGSDEEHCSKENEVSTKPKIQTDCDEFRCGSGECLRYAKVCNGKSHCEDSSDEGGRCESACNKSKNPCSQICNKTPKGPRCSCFPGYILSGDGSTCLDINECELDAGLCSHFCRNTPGSYVCSCARGFSLKSDRQSCKATSGSLDIVFVTNEEIRKVSLKTKRASILTSHTGLTVSGLSVDAHTRHVYWSTAATGKLTRMSQSNEVEKQIERIVDKPKRLAVDWVTSNVYVVDQLQFPTIKVCNIDEEKCATLLSANNADEVTSIVLDPSQGFMFWSELSSNEDKRPVSKIWRSNMDGKNATVVVQSGLSVVSGIALDLVKKQIYWADQGQGVIAYSNYEGSQRQLLPIKELQRPVGVALFEDDIYWMDGGSGKLSKRSLRYPYNWKHIELHAYDAVHFQLVHEALQPQMLNVCEVLNCNEGMCVLTPYGAKCVCESTQDCSITSSPIATKSSDSGSSVGAVLAALFLTIVVMVSIGFTWFFLIKRQGKSFDSLLGFRNLQFENSSFGNSIFSQGIRFSASKLDPKEHQFANPVFSNQQSMGFEHQPLKSVVSKSAESTPSPVPLRRTIPVEIPSCPSSAASSLHSEMSPNTCSPNACLIPVDD